MAIEIKEFVGKNNVKTIKEENLSKKTVKIKNAKESRKKKTEENIKNA